MDLGMALKTANENEIAERRKNWSDKHFKQAIIVKSSTNSFQYVADAPTQ